MAYPRLMIVSFLLTTGCTTTTLRMPPSMALSPQPPIEMMQWGDQALSCEQLKARYDALAPLVKAAGEPVAVPTAPGLQEGAVANVQTAIAAHDRGHQAIARRQYLLELALQKGCP